MNIDKIKAMEDSNLKWILWALAMGWSAILKLGGEEYKMLGEYIAWKKENPETYYILLGKDGTREPSEEWLQTTDFEITGYLYAGELAGNEPIPEGQKFRVKETGEVMKWKSRKESWENTHSQLTLGENLCETTTYDKSEIEPYFE